MGLDRLYADYPPGRVPRFVTTWTIEPLEAEHTAVLEECSGELVALALQDPPAAAPLRMPAIPEPYWVIANSGPRDEVAELVSYAADTRAVERSSATLVVVSHVRLDARPAACVELDLYPATALFARAERVVTAAGFNAVRQAAPWRDKHLTLPFPRRFDDQFGRARLARRSITSAVSAGPRL